MANMTTKNTTTVTVTSLPPSPPDGRGESYEIGVDEESVASLTILLQLLLLLASTVVGYNLRSRGIYVISEAGAALLLGIMAGLIVEWVSGGQGDSWLSFKSEFFLLFLLPPIIFESGYSMNPGPFFRNFGAICAYAFVGTFVSTVIVGMFMYGVGQLGLAHKLNLLDSTLFGALISATDPVTVLAIFSQVHVNDDLHALVFGESVLNDAVAIVLYRSLLKFKTAEVSFGACIEALGMFATIFAGSWFIGTATALGSALFFKYGSFRASPSDEHGSILEASMLLSWPYMAYMLAEGLELSGIVAILFCGITMSHYTVHNLSQHARKVLTAFFKCLANLCETFVFIYIGASTFVVRENWKIGFGFWSLVAIVLARAAHIFPLTQMMNVLRPSETRIPKTHARMLWFAGLRGAIAFSLALGAENDIGKQRGAMLLSATLLTIVLTVLLIGGSTERMITRWDLHRVDSSTELNPDAETAGLIEDGGNSPVNSSERGADAGGSEENSMPTRNMRTGSLSARFEHYDNKVLKPLFRVRDEGFKVTVDDDDGVELSSMPRPTSSNNN
ncbi:sodium/hydrogen exchanger [Pseudoscourfieldia marina]